MKDIKLLVSLVLTCMAFFLGIYYGKVDTESKIQQIKEEFRYLNLDIKKSKIGIESKSENLIITVNGENIEEKEIKLSDICE